MFQIIKKLFNRGGNAPGGVTPTAVAPRARPVAVAAGVPKPAASSVLRPEAAPGVEVASLSLRAILERLPADLKAGINQMPETDVKVILPVNAIMKQLPTGSVKMSLGSLYRQAPNGTFRKTNVEDKRMIEVPLSEIFKTINPGRLHRRNDQRDYEVPEEVHGLFGNGATRSVGPADAAAATPLPAQPAAEPVRPLRMPGLPATAPSSSVSRPTNGHMAAPAPTPAPETAAKGESLNLTGELALPIVEIGTGWSEGIRSELSILAGDTKVVLPVAEVSAGLQRGKVAFTWAQIRNWLTPPPTSPINLADDTLLVLPLKVVAPAFVAATGAKKRQTGQSVGQSMPDFFGPSAGRTPAPEPPAPRAPAAPVAHAPAPTLPAAPAPAPAPAPVAPAPRTVPDAGSGLRLVPTPAADAGTSAARTISSLAELFNAPGKTDWTPNELVKRTCDLPGVIGAVVALEEGLVVAQKLPDGLSADTFAAFMPQIFSRLDKYTGEMQLGDTTEVMVNTVGGPCLFFRRGKLFFATLGRTGGSLPAGLHLVAAELASQNS